MRRGRLFFLLAFVLILGLLGVLVVWRFVLAPSQQAAQQQATPTPLPVRVIVVSQNIPKGYVIEEAVLTTVPWQESALSPGMFTEEQMVQLIGRVVKYDLEAMTPLLDSMLLSEGEQLPTGGSSWALNIPPGMVAVSIPINRLSSVSYAPRPGDHVNVIVTLLFVDLDTDFQSVLPNQAGLVIASGPVNPETKERDPLTVSISPGVVGKTIIDPVLGQAVYAVPGEPQRARMASQMLLQDAVVLQIGDFPLEEEIAQPTPTPQAPEEAPPPTEGAEEPAVKTPDVITLIVRPQDAVTLNYLIFSGAQLTLALRGSNDDSRADVNPVTLQFLLEQYQIPVPVKLPYGLNPRQDSLFPLALPEEPTPTPEQ